MKKTSLADIAKALSVSKTLVSMVLNDQGDLHGINIDTQKRVKEKALELNYKPNRIARGLRTGKTNTIGLIVTDISNPFYSKIARSIENYAYNKGYHLLVSSSDENQQREEELIDMMVDRQVDGLILATTLTQSTSKALENLHDQNLPFVLIDRYIEGFEADMVIGDNEKGAFDLTQHLINKGCKKIGVITISPNYLSSINDRMKGYKSALTLNNDLKEIIIDIPYEKVTESVNETLSKILKNGEIDGLITLNNTLASACFRYFKDNAIKVPKDILFASYDDVEWFGYSSPRITGMKQPINEIGEKSFKLLFEKINSKSETKEYQHVSLPATLNIRESSK